MAPARQEPHGGAEVLEVSPRPNLGPVLMMILALLLLCGALFLLLTTPSSS